MRRRVIAPILVGLISLLFVIAIAINEWRYDRAPGDVAPELPFWATLREALKSEWFIFWLYWVIIGFLLYAVYLFTDIVLSGIIDLVRDRIRRNAAKLTAHKH